MDETNKSLSKTISKKHIDSISPELIGRVFQSGLTVVDRFHCERVSPRWKWIVGAFGWSEQRKLDSEVVFEGASNEGRRNFTHSNLISLLGRFASPNIVELNFVSLVRELILASIIQTAESLSFFLNLKKLHIGDFYLHRFVEHLPASLRNLQTIDPIAVQTLGKLAASCPNLEAVPFTQVVGINADIVNEFMGAFPRQKRLDLAFSNALLNNATFEAIGQLKELIELSLEFHGDFDEETERAFEAMAVGCKSLRKIHFGGVDRMTERALFHLTKMPSLTVVELGYSFSPFTDSVLKAIAKRGLLKRLKVQTNELTDQGVAYLLEQCKSLISLELDGCSQITDQLLESVVAEIHHRHGTPPRALPTGPEDKGILFFGCRWTEINEEKAQEMTEGNPWLIIGSDYRPGSLHL